jgi:2'-5' RNA ligase
VDAAYASGVDAPLVVTLLLEPGAQERFDAERRALFPPGRTAVGAHVTLFHALPGTAEAAARTDLAELTARPAFTVAVTGVLPLGRGAAYRIEAPELTALHAELRQRWRDLLTPQDAQPFRPHITVQNKVDPHEARATVERLRASFTPQRIAAVGVGLWRYAGGPWEPLARYPLRTLDEDAPE